MKITAEEFGKWVLENPTLNSARINGDLETIVNEARHELKDPSINADDVRSGAAALKASHDAAEYKKAQEATAAATGSVSAIVEAKVHK